MLHLLNPWPYCCVEIPGDGFERNVAREETSGGGDRWRHVVPGAG